MHVFVVNYKNKYHLDLAYPSVVTDEFGNTGFWTLVYNQVWCLLSSTQGKLLD